jgi:hypothetical protein
MKVQKVQAFQSQDGCLWENEAEAIEQNINDCISTLNHNCGNSGGDIYDDIKKWFSNHPKDVRYILANIHKLPKSEE